MKKVYIQIVKRGDDCGPVVQWAFGRDGALKMIEKVLPAPLPGYYYKIVE